MIFYLQNIVKLYKKLKFIFIILVVEKGGIEIMKRRLFLPPPQNNIDVLINKFYC